MRRLQEVRRLRGWALAAAGATALIAGCDVSPAAGLEAFATRPTLDSPSVVRAGEPFGATVEVTPRLSGVGAVRIVSGVGRLRAVAPVADTVDLTDVTAPAPRAGTQPVRVVFRAGESVRVEWTLAVDAVAPFLNGGISAVAEMDSVRTDDGRVVALEAWEGGGPGGVAASVMFTEMRPVQVVGG